MGLTDSSDIDKRMAYKEVQRGPGKGVKIKIKVTRKVQKQTSRTIKGT